MTIDTATIRELRNAASLLIADNASVDAAKAENNAAKAHHASLSNTVSKLAFVAVAVDGTPWDEIKGMFAKDGEFEKAKGAASKGHSLYTKLSPYYTRRQTVTLMIKEGEDETEHRVSSLENVIGLLDIYPVSKVYDAVSAWRKRCATMAENVTASEDAKLIAYLEENPGETLDEVRAKGATYVAKMIGKGEKVLARRASEESDRQAKADYDSRVKAAVETIGDALAKGDAESIISILESATKARDSLLAQVEAETLAA